MTPVRPWYFLTGASGDVIEAPDDLLGDVVSWHFLEEESSLVLDEPAGIVTSVRSTPADERVCKLGRTELVGARTRVEKHIKNTYLKRLDVPMDAPKPKLECWMEVTGE